MKTIPQSMLRGSIILLLTVVYLAPMISGAACDTPPSGIVSWWPGEGNANDVIGTNNGTPIGSVGYTSGEVGQAFNLTGSNSLITVGNPAAFQVQDFTIEAWIQRANPSITTYGCCGNGVIFGYGYGGYGLYLDAAGRPTLTKTAFDQTKPAMAITDTALHHVAVTKAGSNVWFYVDGLAYPAPSYNPGFVFSTVAAIGGRGDNLDNGFLGVIDEVSLYNRALTSNEIAGIFNAGSAGKCAAIPINPGVPAISNFSPASGPAGTVVALVGTNFSTIASSNIVYFGGMRAKVLGATSSSVTTVVPAGATFGPISLTANGLVASSRRAFNPNFASGGSLDLTSFGSSFNLPAGNGPGGTAIGDLDGDGRPDLVLINGQDNNVWIYRNTSTNGNLSAATFSPPVILSLAGNPSAVTLADLDGDGRLDLVVGDSQNNQVSIFQNFCTPGNLATNSFSTRVDVPVGQQPRGVAAVDLNGDGRVDIVSANYVDNTVSLLQNLGASGGLITAADFAPHIDLPCGGGSQSVAICDLDGDGQPDLAVVNYTGNSVSLFRNLNINGNLTTNSFGPRVDLPVASGEMVVTVDLDGDGKPDLLVTGYLTQNLSVFQNQSVAGSLTSNSFGPRIDFATGGRAHRLAIGDLDGDGKPDVAVTTEIPNQLVIYKNLSSPGTLSNNALAAPLIFGAGGNPNAISIADLNGDGRPDIFLCNSYDGTVTIYSNSLALAAVPPVISTITPNAGASGTLVTISGTNFSAMAAANIVYFGAVRANVLSASATSLTVSTPPGATYAPITVTANSLTAYAAAPFNVTFSGTGSNSAILGPRLDLATPNSPGATALADLDGDGKPDLLVLGDGVVSIYQNIGTNGTITAGTFGPRVDLPLPSGVDAMKMADVDGDGRLDIVVLNRNLNEVMILQNLCSPGVITSNSFAAPVAFSTGSDPRGLAIRDLDGDGRPELIVGNWADNTVSVFHNLGGGISTNSFAAPILFGVGNNPQALMVADLDGDGLPDIITANNNNETTDSVSILQNTSATGNLSFATHVDLVGLPTSYSLAVGDLDGDGKLDLTVSSFNSGQSISVYRNVSTPGKLTSASFAPHIDFSTGGWGNDVAIGDLDGDGKPDLAVVTQLPDHLSIFKNVSSPGSFDTSSLAPRVDYATGWNPNGITLGDIDGDGRVDLTFSVTYGPALSVYQNLTPQQFVPVAPFITVQPASQTVTNNDTAQFGVTATGTVPLLYQWSFNGTNLVGQTNATLTINNASTAQAGIYFVTVSNQAGGVLSSNAMLTIFVPPVPAAIVAQSPSEIVLVGKPATFSVSAIGTAPLIYAWNRNGVPIPGATNASYTLASAQLSDSGSKFNCLVTNAYGAATSTNVSLKVINSSVANDLCSGAIVITASSYTNQQSTVAATSYGDPVPDCVDGFGHGVWYQFTAPVAGLLLVDTFGSDFDTGLAVYTGSCDSLTEIACNDDTLGVTSQVIMPTTSGTTYYILAGGYSSDAGNLVLHLSHLTPPSFDLEPTNLSVIVSSNALFGATVSGSLPMSFQWYFNNAPLSDGGRINGSSTAALGISGIMTNDGGSYFLVASNIVGVTTSSVAILTPVILPPVFLQTPASQTNVSGSNATFLALVDGTPPYNFQWYLNGNPLTDDGVHIWGSATSSLTISNLTIADAGSYSLTVTNVSGATNATASLTVLVPPSITLNPVGRSVPPGLPTIFSANATGIPAPTFQWQLNGSNLPAATSPNYTNPAIGINDLGFYQFIASNQVGVVTSSVAQLTFGPVAAWGLNTSGESLPPPGLSNVMQVAATGGAGFALRNDGTITTWGTGAGSSSFIPSNATNVVQLAISSIAQSGNYALRADGTVVGWNISPPPLSNIVQVAAGNSFGMALKADGSVTGWGTPGISTVPLGINHIKAVACGYNHTLALRSDGTVTGWGYYTDTNIPTGLTNVIAIAAGYTHSLALKANGSVVAWGSGTGTNLPPNLTNIIAIATEAALTSRTISLALRANGAVVAWGDNTYGQSNPPAALGNLSSVGLAAGPLQGLALVNDGTAQFLQMPSGQTAYLGRAVTLQARVAGAAPLSYQWLLNGTNVPGATNTSYALASIQFGDAGNYQFMVSNSLGTAISLPATVNVISNSSLKVLAQLPSSTNYQGSTFSLASPPIQGNGPLSYQWYFSTTNRNYLPVAGATNDTLTLNPALAGQSGSYYFAVSNQITGTISEPANVRILFARAWGYLPTDPPFVMTNATAIAIGNQGTGNPFGDYYALSAAGKISSWAAYTGPFGETNVSALSNSIVTAVAAGFGDLLALKSDGTVFAAGDNAYGETNIPATANGIAAIACGDYHDLALKADGTVIGWGQNNYQQTTNASATNVVAIAAGGNDSIALRADGSVVTWGLEGGAPPPSTATNVIAVAAGALHFVALRPDGTVVAWGSSTYGQTIIPPSWTNIVAISAGGNHTTVLHNDGTVSYAGLYYQSPIGSGATPADLANVSAIASGGERDVALFGTRAPVFTVQPWNRSLPVNVITNITLTAKCAGVQPVAYQWQFNGTNLPGATNDSLVLGSGALRVPVTIPAGDYQLIASNAYGTVASKYAKITTFIPLGVALNATNLNWGTSGNAIWYGETNTTHDGVSAARSGGIGALQESDLQTTMATNYSGRYTFWWKVSSEQDFDILEFRINGIVQTSISGEVDWQQVSIPVPAGTNVLLWRYSKDASIDMGQDAGWVDQFSFIPDPPLITLQPQPASQSVNYGGTVQFNVSATGMPLLHYFWTQNGNPVGGNSPLLVLNNVSRAQTGWYSVTVTNVGGSTVSSNVYLKVLVPQVLTSPQLMLDGSFQLTAGDIDGSTLAPSDLANFEAQASTNLVDWVTLPGSLSLTNGMLLLQDGGTAYGERYYRIIEH